MDKIIHQSVILNCSNDLAFQLFTKNEYLEKWLTVKADIEPRLGGKYELYWVPDDIENDNTRGCKILALESPHYISFEWKGPKQYKKFMNNAKPKTHVIAIFSNINSGTKVGIIHTGWRESQEWDEARDFFINAWNDVLSQLVTVSKSIIKN
ncbi:SRPBCC family protein [Ekhidna sp.]|uniref:SRPBCC family protein n=1 Tax=Ekhidna sp. TaxID=2608089 RepID=UPI003CCC3F7D